MDIERLKELKSWVSDLRKFGVSEGNEIIVLIDLAITALQEYQPWVSVEDRLPDGDVASVLIYTNKGGVSEGQYYPCIKSWKQFRWSVENADVTHWKPLPEPPKGYQPTISKMETVVCPECGGSGIYREYDEYDRYYLHTCGTCDGSGDVDKQQKSED